MHMHIFMEKKGNYTIGGASESGLYYTKLI